VRHKTLEEEKFAILSRSFTIIEHSGILWAMQMVICKFPYCCYYISSEAFLANMQIPMLPNPRLFCVYTIWHMWYVCKLALPPNFGSDWCG
jgi:hypothetical protein